MNLNPAFWHEVSTRFERIREGALARAEPLLRVDYDADAASKWSFHGGSSATIAEFSSVAGLCALGLESPPVPDVYVDWLDHLRRESVFFSTCGTASGYPEDARLHAGLDADAELVETPLGEVVDVLNAAAVQSRIIADECDKLQLSTRARLASQPTDEAQIARPTAASSLIADPSASSNDPPLAPETAAERRALIDAYLEREKRAGRTARKTVIWKKADYEDRREFQRWQKGELPSTSAASKAFMRVLTTE